MDDTKAKAEAFAKAHPVISSAESIAASPLNAIGMVGQVADYIDSGTVNPNANYNKFTQTSRATREKVQEDMNGVEQFLYGTGMSMGDFLTTTLVTGGFGSAGAKGLSKAIPEALNLLTMGSGAGAQTTIEAKERGLNDSQSIGLGLVAAGAEAVTELFSIEALFDKTTLVENARKYLMQNILAEGSEEGASDVINLIADQLIAKDQSEWNTSIRNYLDQGMSKKEAVLKTLGDNLKQIGLDVLGGALSGGVMGGGSMAINSASNLVGDTVRGRDINRNGESANIIQEGLAQPETSQAYQYATKLNESIDDNLSEDVERQQVSNRQIGKQQRLNAYEDYKALQKPM